MMQEHSTLLPPGPPPPRQAHTKMERRTADSMPGPGQYLPIDDWSKSKNRRGPNFPRQANSNFNRKVAQVPLKVENSNPRVKGALGTKDLIFDGGSRKKLVIQQSAPSIPYKDSTYGYEPIDESGQLLINVGNSFKHTYPERFDSSPGPGAYDIGNDYLKRKNKDPTVPFNRDQSKRSNIQNKSAAAVGPGSYNLDKHQSISRNLSNLGHSAFASG